MIKTELGGLFYGKKQLLARNLLRNSKHVHVIIEVFIRGPRAITTTLNIYVYPTVPELSRPTDPCPSHRQGRPLDHILSHLGRRSAPSSYVVKPLQYPSPTRRNPSFSTLPTNGETPRPIPSSRTTKRR